MIYESNNELYHYGVLGMKWGVRHYQNKDGSYTKKGLERYRKAEKSYDEAKSNAVTKKQAYKTGDVSKSEYKQAKIKQKEAKSEMNRSYKNLKRANDADIGRELYSKGKTVSGNKKINQVSQLAIVLGSFAADNYFSNSGNKTMSMVARYTGVGSTALSAILAGKTHYENKKIKAYYGYRVGVK